MKQRNYTPSGVVSLMTSQSLDQDGHLLDRLGTITAALVVTTWELALTETNVIYQ